MYRSNKVLISQPKDLIARWVQTKQKLEDPWEINYSTIGYYDTKKDRLVAAVVFDRFTRGNEDKFQDCCLHVAGEGLWATNHFLNAVFDYVFNQCGCIRCTGLVDSNNHIARRMNESLGFVHEATLEKALPSGDLLITRMFKEDCRWIDKSFLNERAKKKITLPRSDGYRHRNGM